MRGGTCRECADTHLHSLRCRHASMQRVFPLPPPLPPCCFNSEPEVSTLLKLLLASCVLSLAACSHRHFPLQYKIRRRTSRQISLSPLFLCRCMAPPTRPHFPLPLLTHRLCCTPRSGPFWRPDEGYQSCSP